MANKIQQASIDNVLARVQWLESSLDNPSKVSKRVIPFLANQKSFARLEINASGVGSIAVNTMKSIADNIIPKHEVNGLSGFAYLDSLRVQLKSKTKGSVPVNRIKGDRNNIANLEQEARLLQVENITLTSAYMDLYTLLNTLSHNTGLPESVRLSVSNHIKEHRSLYPHLLTATKNTVELSVVK
jgi:hypothetical protein